MPDCTHSLPLEIVRDHTVVRIGTASALLDTGSPLTFRAPAIVTEQLGRPIRWLVGTDVLARQRVLLDWTGRQVVIGGPAARGEVIPLTPHAGLFQIAVDGAHGSVLAFLDTGAHLSYAPASAVRNLTPVGNARDFFPLFGEFDVPVYEIPIRVGRRRIGGRFGVLPTLLAQLLAGVGGTGWILGSDFFRNRAIQLDFANNRLIDATTVARVTPRQRITSRALPGAGNLGDGVSEDLFEGADGPARNARVRQVTSGIEGWRGWRIEDVGGAPRLKSISAPNVWEGPCISADALPMMDQTQRDVGIHAYATPGQMQSILRGGSALVYGQVTLYGQVCAHELGYRAEHTRIDRLFLRACGRHESTAPARTGLFLLDAIASRVPGVYCACEALEPHQWLTYTQLEDVAEQLGDRYQCDVTIDAERARVSAYACSYARRARCAQDVRT